MSQAELEVGSVAATDGGLTFDDPEAYIPRDRRRALATGATMADRVQGAGLFADISGFTPLTEALATELGPHRGAEELTAVLGRVFHEVITELDRFGGDVIYFSGDAITCWIDGDDGARATASALAMQAAIARVGTVVTPGGSTVTLAMKVAIAVGPARRFVVGDPAIQLIDVLAGRLVDDLAETEHHAGKGEVVLDPPPSPHSAPGSACRSCARTQPPGAPSGSSATWRSMSPTPHPWNPRRASRTTSSGPGCCPPSTIGSGPGVASSRGAPTGLPPLPALRRHRLRQR